MSVAESESAFSACTLVAILRGIAPGEVLDLSEWLVAGAAGFELGSNLYKPAKSLSDSETDARALVTQIRNFR